MRRFLAIALSALSLLAAHARGATRVAPADSPSPPVRLPSEMPRSATAAEGLIEVFAQDVPGDPMGFRLPILGFTSRTVRDIERACKLDMPRSPNPGIIVYALDGTTNDTRVIARHVPRQNGSLAVRIWLPSPGFSDLDLFRFEIAKAYFALWIDRNAPPSSPSPKPAIPDWLVQGISRAIDPATAEADTLLVLDLWSSARLPFFPALCTDLRFSSGKAAALSGYLASWIREAHLLKPTLARLAAGSPWDGARLAADLTSAQDPIAQDQASDERLARLARSVLSPGRATPWDIKVFCSRLLLYPQEFDKNTPAFRTSLTFRQAIPRAAASPALRIAAWRKSKEMPFCAIGRGEALAAAAQAYRQFLLLLAHNAPAENLHQMLDKADAKMEKIIDENRKNHNR